MARLLSVFEKAGMLGCLEGCTNGWVNAETPCHCNPGGIREKCPFCGDLGWKQDKEGAATICECHY